MAAKNEALAVRWTAPANDGSANITDYDVQYRACEATGGDTSVLTCNASPTWGSWTDRADETTSDTATSDTVSGLTNGTAYQVRVRAANRSHESEWTATEHATPAKQPPDAPDVASSTLNGDEVVVKWNEPADNGGKKVDSYDVRYRTRGSSAASWPSTWFSYHHSGGGTQASFKIASGAGGSAGGARAASAVAASVPSSPVSPNGGDAQAQPSGARAQTQSLLFQAQVRALNSLGAGAWSPLPPDAPAGLTLTARHASLHAAWSPATENGSAVTGYDVRHRRCTATDKSCTSSPSWGGWTNDNSAIMSTSTTIASLVNGIAYQVQVRANSAADAGDWSQAATGTPEAAEPDAPAAPTLTVKNSELGVAWTAPAGNGADISDYDVRYRACTATPLTCTSSPAWGSWTTLSGSGDPGTSTSAAITGLANGTKHQVQVRAANSVGSGEWSSSSNGTPAPHGSSNAAPPDAPAAPTVTAGHQSLTAAWAPPAINGAPITDYDVAYRACTATDGNSSVLTCATNPTWGNWTEWNADVTSTDTTTTIVGLANGAKHQARVRAGSSAGNSAWSTATPATPDTQAPTAPAAPSLTGLNGGLGASWTAPLTNGTPITDYDVRYRACTQSSDLTCAANPTWGNWASLSGDADPGSATAATIQPSPSLTNGTAYQVQVRAANSAGRGGWSAAGIASPAAEPPHKPATPSVAARHQGVAVTWKTPNTKGTPITGYQLAHRRCTANPPTCANSPNVGDWSAWTTLDYAGPLNDSDITYPISGLTNGAAYQARVGATSAAGTSEWSDADPLDATGKETAVPAPQAPDAPAAPTLTVWTQQLRVSWAPPAANGSAITDYDIQYRACTLATDLTCSNTSTATWESSWTSHAHTGTGTTATITGLTNGTAYQVQVQATNSVGDSPWSNSTNAAPAAQKPDKPSAPTLTVDNASLGVSWTAPAANGSAITDYDVRYCNLTDDSDSDCADASDWTEWDASTKSTATSATITGLTNAKTYRVAVRAVNSVGGADQGNGPWSDPASAQPAAQKPSKPSAPTLMAANASLEASWTAPANNGSAITDYDIQYRACTATDSDTTDLACDGTTNTWGNWTAHTHTGSATTATITGLTNDTAYQVQIQATNSIGDSAWSNSTNAAPAAQKPSKPTAPTLTADNASLDVSWTAPANNGSAITDYDIQYRACTATDSDTTDLACDGTTNTWGNWTAHTHTGSATTATITGLTNDTAYQVQIQATNSVGDSPWSSSTNAAPAAQKPSKPTAPTLTADNASLDVSWTAPANNGAAITDYDIQYRACTATDGNSSVLTCATSPTWGSWASHTHNGTGTTTTITGLTNDTAYQVQVQATNSIGDSPWSNSTNAAPEAQKPSKPTAPTLTADNASLDVSWTAPANNGSAITDYDIQFRACTLSTDLTCSNTSTATWESTWTSHAHTGTGTTAIVTGLTNGTAYQVQVQATNGVGDSPWSDSTKAAPAAQKPDTPSAPTLTVDNASLGVSWTAPASNGSAITDYNVQFRACTLSTDLTCSNTSTATWESTWTSHAHTGTGTAATIAGLTNDTAYQVQIQATNSVGDSPWSGPAKATPAAQKPSKPAAPALTVDNASLAVSWTAPADNGDAISDYDIQYRACTLATDLSCSNTSTATWESSWTSHAHSGTGTTATITGLTNGTAYQVQVQATNGVGDSPWSASATASPAPQEPDKPSAPTLAVDNASLGVSWTAPANNGSAITDYDIEYCNLTDDADSDCADAADWTEWDASTKSTATTATITGLTNTKTYRVRVRAVNSVGGADQGNGPWSDPASAAPAAQKPSKPAAPTLAVDNASLEASWTAPANNGSAITGYDVQYRACTLAADLTCSDTSTATWGSWNSHTHTGTGTIATIGSLTNDTAYQAQVRATNSIGDSPWSNSAKAVPAAQKPSKPSTPTLTVDNASLEASWSAPAANGSAITDYDIQYRACTYSTDLTCSDTSTAIWGSWNSRTHSGIGTTATITGLTNDTAYQVQVQATNSIGDSPWSDPAKATPAAQKPDKPSAPTLTVGNASLGVSWTAPAANGSAITDYDIQYRACTYSTDLTCSDTSTAAWGSWNSHTHTGTGTTATIGSLTNDTAYQVQVQAANSIGDSPWSDSARATPGAQKPSKPTAPTLTVDNASLDVSWTAPANNGDAITDYDIQYRACTATDGDTTDLACDGTANTWGTWTDHSHTGTGTTATIGSLTNGTAYQVQVQATNRVGDSPWSDSNKAAPAPQKPSKPAAPTLTADNASLDVSWTAPAANGSAVTDYNVQYRACTYSSDLTCSNTSTATWESTWTSHTHTGAGTTATVTGLTNGTAYQVQVQATNSVGDSPWSNSTKATPAAQKPDKPAAPTLTVGHASLSLSWTAPASNGAAITDYDIQYRACTATDGDTNDLACDGTTNAWATTWTSHTHTGTSTTATITGLTNGTAYQVQVQATNSVGDSPWSNSTKATPAAQKPSKPTAPTLIVDNASLDVSWTAPANNGSAITDYDIQYRACTYSTDLTCSDSSTATWGSWASHTHTGAGTTATITGLTNGTAYQVQVQATNSVGDSPWSNSTKATPAAQKPSKPAAPTLTVGHASLSLSWTAPANNGASITDYDIQYRACTATDNDTTNLACDGTTNTWGTWTEWNASNTGTGTTATITGLTNGTAYQVQVQATNSVGDSPWSNSAKAHPPRRNPTSPRHPPSLPTTPPWACRGPPRRPTARRSPTTTSNTAPAPSPPT